MQLLSVCRCVLFFFNDTATTEIYTLSLHDALPISRTISSARVTWDSRTAGACSSPVRSEEHTSELQSLAYLVCRLLLEKKQKQNTPAAQQPDTCTCSAQTPLYLCICVRETCGRGHTALCGR